MDLESCHDAELVSATLSGDREAFGLLYDRHARMVRVVVTGVSGDWSSVDDMVQECFLRGYRKLATLRDPALFGAWIVGIGRQVGRERRRKLRRDRHEFGEAKDWELASSTDAGSKVDDGDQLEVVMRRVAALPERERLAIHAYFVERQPAEQIAQSIGLSRSGFYALVQRAVARLAAPYEACRPGERRE